MENHFGHTEADEFSSDASAQIKNYDSVLKPFFTGLLDVVRSAQKSQENNPSGGLDFMQPAGQLVQGPPLEQQEEGHVEKKL